MDKILKNRLVKLLIVPCLLFFILTFNYQNYQATIPISYFDEVLWVGRSYFFDFFIRGDFKNKIWQSENSYDQPKLVEYLYGAWLYPSYLQYKKNVSGQFDYTQFLIKNGFYDIDESHLSTYADYRKSLNLINFDENMSGHPTEWIAKYGQKSMGLLNLIYMARNLNTLLLAGAVVLSYFLALLYGGVVFATIFAVLYGFNSLIMNTGLIAQSEALFLFTLNFSLLLMSLYFLRQRKISYLLFFSILAGLSLSTKLNGFMLIITFFVLNCLFLTIFNKERIKYFYLSILPIIIALVIFIILNPFTYSNPLKNIGFMIDYRWKTAISQAKHIPDAYVSSGIAVTNKIFKNFYFSDQVPFYNGNVAFGELNSDKYYGIYLFGLCLIGFLYLLSQALKGHGLAISILYSAIVSFLFTSYYLIINWPRYYVHLVLFVVLFQSMGLFSVGQFFYKYSKKLLLKSSKSRKRQ